MAGCLIFNPCDLQTEVLEYFLQNKNVNLDLYKSWITILEKMSLKSRGTIKALELIRRNIKNFYNLLGEKCIPRPLITS